MKSLITVINSQEAKEVINTGLDILDIKNPDEGSLGAPSPKVIKEIKEVIPYDMKISIAVGDIPNLPCTVSLAVFGAAQFKPDYIKIGLKGTKTYTEAFNLVRQIVFDIKSLEINTKIVATGFADYKKINSVNPMDIPEVIYESGADVAMIDTAIKNGSSLLNMMPLKELEEFVGECHDRKLEIALAGSLSEDHIDVIREIGGNIFGVRGAVCSKNDREGKLEGELVKKIVSKIKGGGKNDCER